MAGNGWLAYSSHNLHLRALRESACKCSPRRPFPFPTGNGWLAYSPALHLLRESGTTIGLLDLLDERKLRPGEAAVLALIAPDWT